jgi:hypothetical protein
VFLLAISFFPSLGQLVEPLSPVGSLQDFSGVEFNPVLFHQFPAQNLIYRNYGNSSVSWDRDVLVLQFGWFLLEGSLLAP